MTYLGQAGKTPLINIRSEHCFEIAQLAEDANVLERVVMDMLILVNPVPRVEAERVLAVVSSMTGKTYTLDNVDVKIHEESNDTKQSE